MNIYKFIVGGIAGRKILKKNNDYMYLIFPGEADLIAYYGLLYADEFKYLNGIKNIVVVTADEVVEKVTPLMIRSPYKIFYMEKKKLENLLYNLSFHVDFMGDSIIKNLFYISDIYPYGVSTQILLKNYVFDCSYYVWNRLYNKKNFYRSHEPKNRIIKYDGYDSDISEFLKKCTNQI